jgi:glycine/D-amino acid oxidase-like deaminating enzyme
MELTERRDLRGGRSCWIAEDENSLNSDEFPSGAVDIAIVGAGVMGAMLADRLSELGRQVLVLDRRLPAHGSTAASTALVMWGADVPLIHLAQTIGMDEAKRRWRRVFDAVRNLSGLIDRSGIDCGRIDRPELYLAGTLLDETALKAEGEARRAAGLPSQILEATAVSTRFAITPRAALVSSGSYEVDPVKLTLGLLTRARRRGTSICFPIDVARIEQEGNATLLHGTNGSSIKHSM